MQEAFPPEEYRPKEKQLAILDDVGYKATVLKDGEAVIGFIAVWRLNGFTFAEHFAVSSNMRNKGVGTEFLKEYLKSLDTPLVLEVENVDDEIAKRRIGFYKRIGFIETDICYNQPNFHTSNKVIPLKIMYHPNGRCLDTQKIRQEIFEKVYKIKK